MATARNIEQYIEVDNEMKKYFDELSLIVPLNQINELLVYLGTPSEFCFSSSVITRWLREYSGFENSYKFNVNDIDSQIEKRFSLGKDYILAGQDYPKKFLLNFMAVIAVFRKNGAVELVENFILIQTTYFSYIKGKYLNAKVEKDELIKKIKEILYQPTDRIVVYSSEEPDKSRWMIEVIGLYEDCPKAKYNNPCLNGALVKQIANTIIPADAELEVIIEKINRTIAFIRDEKVESGFKQLFI